MASGCDRGGSGWILGKFLHGKGGQALTRAVVEALSLKMLKKHLWMWHLGTSLVLNVAVLG